MVGESELKELESLTALCETTLASSDGGMAREYLAGRGLLRVGRDARLGFVGTEVSERYKSYEGMLLIPFINLLGQVTAVRFRKLTGGGAKYLQPPHSTVLPYRAASIGDAETAHVTEGELDCLSLVAAGFDGVVGFPGASTWRDYYKHLFDGCAEVYVWADADDAGLGFAERVLDGLPQGRLVVLPDGEDVNSLLVSRGGDYLEGLCFG